MIQTDYAERHMLYVTSGVHSPVLHLVGRDGTSLCDRGKLPGRTDWQPGSVYSPAETERCSTCDARLAERLEATQR